MKKQRGNVMSQIDSTVKSISILERWEKEIIAGNQCLIKKDLNGAGCHYELARQTAETVFKEWLNPYEAASALVVTYHNIADLQRKMGNSEGVHFYLEKVHKTVLKTLLATSVDDQRFYSLLCASKRTYKALLSYKKCGVYS